jgi:hypothetical protein
MSLIKDRKFRMLEIFAVNIQRLCQGRCSGVVGLIVGSFRGIETVELDEFRRAPSSGPVKEIGRNSFVCAGAMA